MIHWWYMSLKNLLTDRGRKVLARCVVAIVVVIALALGFTLTTEQEEKIEGEVREAIDVFVGDGVITVIPTDGDGVSADGRH